MTDPTIPIETRFTLQPRVRAERTEIRIERGLLEGLPALLEESVGAAAYAVVSDENVAGLYGAGLRDGLLERGAVAELFTFPAGEASKTPQRWVELVEALGAMALGRDGCVVAVGGGVTGDLAGFTAASYARGVALVQVPTSLLAMIDASIGGKTGVDLRAGKNLAGAFHDPRLVAVDPDALSTLPEDELRTGLAEAVKHGAIADAEYLAFLESEAERILALDPEVVDRVVAGSIRIKTGVVERDAREGGERAVLNFGHTVAHGVERVTGYAVSHGNAVAMGMVAEARIGERIGATEAGTADRLESALRACGLPVRLPPHVDVDALLAAVRTDKKAREGEVHYALIAAPGSPARGPSGQWTRSVPDADVAAAISLVAAPTDRGGEV